MNSVQRRALDTLTAKLSWPAELTDLATLVAKRGRLTAAISRTDDRMMVRPGLVGSSNSSVTVSPARTPPRFSHLPNWDATYYTLLEQEMRSELGEHFDPGDA